MQNIDFNKRIKSRTVRNILIISVIVILALLVVGLFTNKLDSVFGVTFHHERKIDTTKHANPSVYEIHNDSAKAKTIINMRDNNGKMEIK